MKFDMHCHTAEGSPDSQIAIKEYVRLLKRRGFQGMLITDHNSYKGYEAYRKQSADPIFQDFTILKGIEYDTLNAGHFLIVLPHYCNTGLFAIQGLPLHLLLPLVHHFGGIIGPAHPFGEKFLSFGRSRVFRQHRYMVAQFDFLEGFNPCESKEANNQAIDLAREYHLTRFGGSDSHKPDNVGLAYTEFHTSIQTEDDLIRYVKEKNPTTVGGRFYHNTVKAQLGKWNDLLVYAYFAYNKAMAFLRSPKLFKAFRKIGKS